MHNQLQCRRCSEYTITCEALKYDTGGGRLIAVTLRVIRRWCRNDCDTGRVAVTWVVGWFCYDGDIEITPELWGERSESRTNEKLGTELRR